MATQDLTLGALLDQGGAEPPAGRRGRGLPRADVRGVHPTEVEHPTHWMGRLGDADTAIRFGNDADEQRELVAELAGSELVALGFGTGITFDTIPEPIIDEARRRGFPLFEVPYGLQRGRGVCRAILPLNRDFHILRRSVSMQNYLMESLDGASPEEELIRRLGAVLDSDIALYRPDGQLETLFRRGQRRPSRPRPTGAPRCGGGVPAAALLQRFSVGDAHVVSSPIESEGASTTGSWSSAGATRR